MFYEFRCPRHGVYELQRPMRDCRVPAHCPDCGELSERVWSIFSFGWGFGGWDFACEGMGGPRGDELELRHHQ